MSRPLVGTLACAASFIVAAYAIAADLFPVWKVFGFLFVTWLTVAYWLMGVFLLTLPIGQLPPEIPRDNEFAHTVLFFARGFLVLTMVSFGLKVF